MRWSCSCFGAHRLRQWWRRVLAPLTNRRGITLLELMVAMLIMALVATMLYSVLNLGINFSRKGEVRAREMGRERALLELLHRQIHGAWYDRIQKKVLIGGTGKELKMVTTAPLLYRDQGVVLAIYLYEPKEDILYYTEKIDFFNPTYFQDGFEADRKEMLALVKGVGDIQMEYKAELGQINIISHGRSYDLPVRCWNKDGG